MVEHAELWKLDKHTRSIGKAGVAEARKILATYSMSNSSLSKDLKNPTYESCNLQVRYNDSLNYNNLSNCNNSTTKAIVAA